MKPYQRVRAVLEGKKPDRTPRFEIWIDALYQELGVLDPVSVHPELGQDCLLIPAQNPPTSRAWGNGLDEFGRIWKDGMYCDGAVKDFNDLKRFTPSEQYALQYFDRKIILSLKSRYPDHFPFFGTHIGPFMGAYMCMGMEKMFRALKKEPDLVRAVLETRTAWCLAVFRRAVEMGAELIVMGDDAAYGSGPMISPQLWQSMILPFHQRIAGELKVPVIWHSDGRLEKLLPFAVEAGFAGVHGLEPAAGNDLARVKIKYGEKLILIGNVDVNILCDDDLQAVKEEVNRCLLQGGSSGFMLSTSNSIFKGMNPGAVREYFNY
jgi:uroporphyrinogen decarboxylase